MYEHVAGYGNLEIMVSHRQPERLRGKQHITENGEGKYSDYKKEDRQSNNCTTILCL
jgi:hypothetical protein